MPIAMHLERRESIPDFDKQIDEQNVTGLNGGGGEKEKIKKNKKRQSNCFAYPFNEIVLFPLSAI